MRTFAEDGPVGRGALPADSPARRTFTADGAPQRRVFAADTPAPADTSWAEEIAGLATGIGVGGLATAGATALALPTGPFAPIIGSAVGGLVGGLAGRATENVLEGESPLEGYGLTDAAIDTAAGPLLMGAGRLVRGARALAGFSGADDIARGASKVGTGIGPSAADDVARIMPDLGPAANVDVLTAEVKDLGLRGGARRVFSSASALGHASDRPEGKLLARAIDSFGAIDRKVQAQAVARVSALKRLKLTPDERKMVGMAAEGKVATDQFTPKMHDALGRVRTLLQGYDDLMRSTGHQIRDPKTGELFDYAAMVDEGATYFPQLPTEEWVERQARHATMKLGAAVNPQTFRRDVSMGMRVSDLADEDRVWDYLEVLPDYIRKHTPRIAATHAFGPQVVREAGEVTDFGAVANRLMSSFAQKGLEDTRSRYTFAAFQDALNSVYKAAPQTTAGRAIEKSRRALATAQLGLSPWRQVAQAGSTVMHQGVLPSVRGALDVASDPQVRGFLREAGVATQPGADFMTLEGVGLRGMIGKAEKALRMHAGATSMRSAQRLAKVAAKQHGSRRGISRAIQKQLAELGLDADTIATRGLDTNDLARAAQYGADRIQFQSYAPGQSGTQMLADPVMRLLTQYKPFAGSASRLAIEDIGKPLLSGDASLTRLGLARAARIPAIIGAAGLGEVLASGAAMREPDPQQAFWYGAGAAFGVPADIVGNLAQGYGLQGQAVPPAIGQMERMGRSLDQGNLGRFVTDVAAMHPLFSPIAPAVRELQR